MTKYKFLKAYDGHAAGEEFGYEDTASADKLVDVGILEKSADTSGNAVLTELVALLKSLSNNENGQPKGPRIEHVAAEADKTKSLGDQVKCIAIVSDPQRDRATVEKAAERLHKVYGSTLNKWDVKTGDSWGMKASAQVEGTAVLGGYGVAPEYSNEIFKLAIEESDIARLCRQVTMTSNEYRFPKLDQTGTNVAGTSTGMLAGIVAGWSSETNTGNQTNAKLKQGILKAGELRGYTVLSNELLQDNQIGFESELNNLFQEAIPYYTDLAIFNGDGVDKPVGIVNAAASLTVTRANANIVAYNDLVAMKAKLLPKYVKGAMWVFNQTVMPQIYEMVDAANRNLWLPNIPGSTSGPVSYAGGEQLLGIPFVFTEKTPVLGSRGDAMLINPKGYILGRRISLEIAASPHVNFLANEMTYRFIARLGGQPILDKPYTMLDGTNQLSTFVVLV